MMLNNFTLELTFNKPVDISGEAEGNSVITLQTVILQNGSNRGQLFLTVGGQKLVIANLSARRLNCNLNLRITEADGDVTLSCSQGCSMIINGFIEELGHEDHSHHEGGCCDHDHHEESVSEASENEEGDEEMEDEDEEEESEKEFFDELASEGEEDEEDEDEDEDEDEEDEDEDEDEDDEDEDDDEEDEEEEEEEIPASKKVTFNPKEQGPHKAAEKAAQAPLKPAIKQQDKPQSKVGTTVTMKGGLKYTIVKEGTGPVATNGRRVNVKYVGCLASNGRQFDKGQIRFRLGAGEVIKGWDMGVTGMRVREARRLLIPAHLGYGGRGAPPAIPPNATLAFEVELLDTQ
jgi:FK506-binding nuclear protein